MSQISRNLYKKLQKQYSRRINLDLSRIKKVLQKLNNPQDQVDNVINIIGSDGKNSVLTSLKYFLEANKEKVNTFTSPHLYDVRQRFWLGDRFISINEINNIIKNKIAIYDLTLDKRAQKIGHGKKLEKYPLDKLPKFLIDNLRNYQEWID